MIPTGAAAIERIATLKAWLEATEKERDELRGDRATLQQMVYSLKDRVEVAEKERDKLKELNSALCAKSNSQVIYNARLAEENYALRAKIEAMERHLPYGAIEKILTEVMDIATANGADSRSMPDEYVEVAMWLCGVPGAQQAPSMPDLLESLRCACNYIDKLGGVSQQYRAMLASPEANP